MKKNIKALFPDIGREILIELDDSRSPKTFQTILENLPVEINITKWGDELYTERTHISAIEENAKREVDYLDVAYWPEGNALCLFYGPTPISKDGQILAYSPVNIVGKIMSNDNEKDELLSIIKDNTKVIFKSV
ncbi:MAG TPA: cyclophilin-like fold protein [Nitrososphaeraceae archaeon]|nr:cyclophilin-like fold protein [Nitrososphaeraceae archaeon]